MAYIDLNNLSHTNFLRLILSFSCLPSQLPSHADFKCLTPGICQVISHSIWPCCSLCLAFPPHFPSHNNAIRSSLFLINCHVFRDASPGPQIEINTSLIIPLHRTMFFSITEHLKSYILFFIVTRVHMRSTFFIIVYEYSIVSLTIQYSIAQCYIADH